MNTGRIITTALAASILAIPAMAADAPGYFKVPGTETTLKVYGRAQVTGYYNLQSADTTIGAGTRTDYTGTNEKGTVSSGTTGRFGFDSLTPSAYGDVHVKLEYEASSNANAANLRYAYGEFAGLLVGQTDSLFRDLHYRITANDTERADFNGHTRERQIRYTLTPAKGVTVAFSMEQDASASTSAKPGHQFVGAFQYAADWGGVAASIGRMQQKTRTAVAFGTPGHSVTTASGSGTAFAVSGQYNITANDSVQAHYIKGGSVFGSNGGGFVANAGGYDFYKTTSMHVGYSHTWNPTFNSCAGIGKVVAPKNDTLGKVKQTETEFFLNTTWNITKTVNLTGEYYNSSFKYAVGNPVTKIDGVATNKTKESNINLYLTYNLF